MAEEDMFKLNQRTKEPRSPKPTERCENQD